METTVKKPLDSRAYKAFRIVLMHFIKPCIEAGERKKSTQLQRWWRRIGGNFIGFSLATPLHMNIPLPPGLWRQVNSCRNELPTSLIQKFHKRTSTCRGFPMRWSKKYADMRIETLRIKYYMADQLLLGNHNVSYEDLESRFPTDMVHKYYSCWIDDNCACNNRPAHIWIDYKRKYNQMNYIFTALAGDNLTTETRARLSNFVINRLKPKQ